MRIAESLAKMRLAPFAVDADVDEALRLFQVSTLDAAMTGSLAGLWLMYVTVFTHLHIFLFHASKNFPRSRSHLSLIHI